MTHTGPYGSGNYSLFDFNIYTANLILVFRSNLLYTAVFFLVLITSVVSVLPSFKRYFEPEKRNMLIGLTATFVLNVMMVARHFSSHYLYMSYNLVIFGIVLCISLLPVHKIFRHSLVNKAGIRITCIYLAGFVMLFILIQRIQFSPSFVNPRLKGLEFVTSTVKKTQRIIVLEHSGPFAETALLHGLAYSNGMRPEYALILKNDYPSGYFYNASQDIVYDWIHEYDPADLFSRSRETYIYYSSAKDTFPALLQARIEDLQQKGYINDFRTAYKDAVNRDFIYKIVADTQKLTRSIIGHPVAFLDFDSIAADTSSFTTGLSTANLRRTGLLSGDVFYSGDFSVKLHQGNPYSPAMKIKAKKGWYKITVRRKSADGIGMIVASDKTGTRLYKTNGIASDAGNSWQTVELVFEINNALADEEISIFLWYPGHGTSYFDDLRVVYFEVP